jgi:hypothetical protein
MELLEMPEAQQQRYMAAYEITKRALRELGISPARGSEGEEAELMDLDEMEEGYPRMTLDHVYEIVSACAQWVKGKGQKDSIQFTVPAFQTEREKILQFIQQEDIPQHWTSWLGLKGRLGRLKRLKVFDNPAAHPLKAEWLLRPGCVALVDLSDTDSVQLRNLVIAELLRSLQIQQDRLYEKAVKDGTEPIRTMVLVEEAHEFLSAERIKQMPNLSQQVARIARRGRKRWMGLVFITQLPQHLPDEVLGLLNNTILHKVADSGVIARLKRSVGGVDESLWTRLPSLAPGQAVVSLSGMTRPLLVAMDPSPCKLRMVD